MNFMPRKDVAYVLTNKCYGAGYMSKKIPTGRQMRHIVDRMKPACNDYRIRAVPLEIWQAKKESLKGFPFPKQWANWCIRLNLRQYGSTKNVRLYDWGYLKGRDHHWRINDQQMLQCGDTYEDHDRWALASIVETPAPKTFKELQHKVNALLEIKRQIEAGELEKPEYGSIVVD